jgi:hypothetical protein
MKTYFFKVIRQYKYSLANISVALQTGLKMEAPWLYDSILNLVKARASMYMAKAGVKQWVLDIAALTSKQQATNTFCKIMCSLAPPLPSPSAMGMREICF